MNKNFKVVVFVDSDGYDLELEHIKYPDGAVQYRIKQNENSDLWGALNIVHGNLDIVIEIEALLKSSDDIMSLLMLKDAIDQRIIPYRDNNIKTSLRLPYVPYCRQDRVANLGESHSLRVFSKLINSMDFDAVILKDVHSDVTPALLNNAIVEDYAETFNDILYHFNLSNKNWALVVPDAGASKKLNYLVGKDIKTIQFYKTRDTVSGKITGTHTYELENYSDVDHYLIIDDICDGGRTFTEIAKVIKGAYAGKDKQPKIYLFVTNGIFSKGKEVLHEYFDEVKAEFDWTEE